MSKRINFLACSMLVGVLTGCATHAPVIGSGKIVSAKLITGADISVFDSDNPTPLLLSVPTMLGHPADSCVIAGEAVADLATERVRIRGTELTCAGAGTPSTSIPIRGFFVGPDGKVGIRANLMRRTLASPGLILEVDPGLQGSFIFQ